jgi:hypothetical protein
MSLGTVDALIAGEKYAGRIKAYVRDANGRRFVGSVRPFDQQPLPGTTHMFRLPVELTYGKVIPVRETRDEISRLPTGVG